MSDQGANTEQAAPSENAAPGSKAEPIPTEVQAAAGQAAPTEKLDGVEEIDFLLEEIESKIAPLALA